MLINIIYASTSGNVEAVCEKIEEVLEREGFEVMLHRAEETSIDVLLNSQFCILATSTWEHGELNPFFKNFYDQMAEKDFTGKKSAFVGLGDRRYEPVLFAEAIEILKRRFLKNRGTVVGETLKIEGEPYKVLDTDVVEWVTKLSAILHGY